jgi:hypothetical protein
MRKKRPKSWKAKQWFLHHDKAQTHTSMLIQDLLTKMRTAVIPQPLDSPDVAPAHVFLFPKLKSIMKE